MKLPSVFQMAPSPSKTLVTAIWVECRTIRRRKADGG